MFIPGETIAHRFNMPFTSSDVRIIYVSYRQDNRLVLTKTVYPAQVTNTGVGGTFTVTLSQEESLLFEDDKKFTVQLNVMTRTGNARCTSVEMKGVSGLQHIREVVT